MRKLILILFTVFLFTGALFAQAPVTGNVSGLSSGHSVYLLIVVSGACEIQYLPTGIDQYGNFSYQGIPNKCSTGFYPIDNADQYSFSPQGITVGAVGGVCNFGQTCPTRSGLQFYATRY